MRFETPEGLWLLAVIVPALSAFLWWAWRRKRALIAQFVQSRLLASLTVGVSAVRQKWRRILSVLAVALTLFALARPQWGFDWEEARQRGLDIIIAIDTSKSMLAEDIPPSRLKRAKLAALDLLKLARTDRVGLIAFAGTAFLQCPLSLDDEAFKQSLEFLDANIIPQGGTALAEAILTARSAFKDKNDNYKVLVLFTDGEDHDGHARDTARDAAKVGMRIFTIGVGTPSGELVRISDAKGRSDYLKDSDGNAIRSRLNEAILRDIAQDAEGFYMPLSGAETMKLLYERGLAPLPKAEFASRQVRRWHERYQWFLGAALVLLLVEMFLPERKRVARTAAMLDATNTELRKAIGLAVLLLLPAALVQASPATALGKYQRGRFEEARFEYERLLAKKPQDPQLHFNAGAAAFQAKEYETAEPHFQAALAAKDLRLQEQAYYNLGTTQFRLGEEATALAEKQQAWERALRSFQSALKLNPKDADAQFNAEVTAQRLDELLADQRERARADDEVRKRNYKGALQIMENQLRKNAATGKDPGGPADYVKKLRDITNIVDSVRP